MSHSDYVIWWVAGFFSALTVVAARLAQSLFRVSELPPADPAEARHWRLKRRWQTVSELSALPAFATIAVVTAVYFKLDLVAVVIMSMMMGGVGFGFLLNALSRIAKKKLEDSL